MRGFHFFSFKLRVTQLESVTILNGLPGRYTRKHCKALTIANDSTSKLGYFDSGPVVIFKKYQTECILLTNFFISNNIMK